MVLSLKPAFYGFEFILLFYFRIIYFLVSLYIVCVSRIS